MDPQDLHELAISYCETIFKRKSPTPKQYINTYLKAIRSFENQLSKTIESDIGGMEVIEEIKHNITALDNEKEEDEDIILF
ncbi:MAG TPA: hypothetical protein GX741_00950 [Erysipelothrix sp.]|nr:hypothetical protein [Erysipelothrix sp.]